jgi:hypothetical protein
MTSFTVEASIIHVRRLTDQDVSTLYNITIPDDSAGWNDTEINNSTCSDGGDFVNSQCQCYADRMGSRCERRRRFECRIKLLSPNLTCSSPDAPIQVLRNLYTDPNCLKFHETDTIELEYRIDCHFLTPPASWSTPPSYFIADSASPVRCLPPTRLNEACDS